MLDYTIVYYYAMSYYVMLLYVRSQGGDHPRDRGLQDLHDGGDDAQRQDREFTNGGFSKGGRGG